MLRQIRFPPLPKHKPKDHLELKINTIAHKEQRMPTEVQTIVVNPIKVGRTISREADNQKARPLSSRSVRSTRSKDSSQDSVRPICKESLELRTKKGTECQLPKVTAKSWIVFEMRQGKSICGKREFKRRQIASLTKMMNLITIIELVASLNLDPSKIKARATLRASTVTGTTAELLQNRVYSLEDLYYGMMLPSGNDAATMIAEIGGCMVKAKQDSSIDITLFEDEERLSQAIKEGNNVGNYLREMNRLGKTLGMLDTNLANPHGLSNRSSHSTAFDLAKLCTYSMKNSIFRKVVNTQTYEYSYKLPPQLLDQDKENQPPQQEIAKQEKVQQKKGQWENTNRMLGQGWSGIKTGITPNAGPCLAASCLKTIKGKQCEFLVVLLSSESMQARWGEAQDLVDWAQGQWQR